MKGLEHLRLHEGSVHRNWRKSEKILSPQPTQPWRRNHKMGGGNSFSRCRRPSSKQGNTVLNPQGKLENCGGLQKAWQRCVVCSSSNLVSGGHGDMALNQQKHAAPRQWHGKGSKGQVPFFLLHCQHLPYGSPGHATLPQKGKRSSLRHNEKNGADTTSFFITKPKVENPFFMLCTRDGSPRLFPKKPKMFLWKRNRPGTKKGIRHQQAITGSSPLCLPTGPRD